MELLLGLVLGGDAGPVVEHGGHADLPPDFRLVVVMGVARMAGGAEGHRPKGIVPVSQVIGIPGYGYSGDIGKLGRRIGAGQGVSPSPLMGMGGGSSREARAGKAADRVWVGRA